MTHGSQCGCMMCSVGKKMGIVKNEEGGHEEETCSNCGGTAGEGGTCTCGPQ